VLLNALRACLADGPRTDVGRSLLRQLEDHVQGDDRSRSIMVWLGAGVDAADGQLTLKRPLLAPWTRMLDLRWTPDRSQAVVEAILAVHQQMTEATGGQLRPNAAWSVFRNMVTLHPLGGCNMGTTPETGVVNHLGQVFGYQNLYVVDGAILPAPLGRNPSHTIAALAEHVAAHIH
jgi:cholesterol oxidase